MSKLICLLPVRNGEADLPGYFASVARFADGIVALDDGSTDGTRALLEASPLVNVLLTNPVRERYKGWDDAANRNRLLAAAAELEPAWLLSLDADERIPADDAAALRAFLETDALPELAYGFKVFRMWQDLDQYDAAGLWVYRLFASQPGQRFPEQRLHFVPIPTTSRDALMSAGMERNAAPLRAAFAFFGPGQVAAHGLRNHRAHRGSSPLWSARLMQSHSSAV